MNNPGRHSKSFNIDFADHVSFKKGDILKLESDSVKVKVIKVYNPNVWWRKLLQFFGFKTVLFTVKVKQI